MAALLDMPKEALVGQLFESFIVPVDVPVHKAAAQAAIKQGQAHLFTFPLVNSRQQQINFKWRYAYQKGQLFINGTKINAASPLAVAPGHATPAQAPEKQKFLNNSQALHNLSTLLNHSRQMCILVNNEYKIQAFNKLAASILYKLSGKYLEIGRSAWGYTPAYVFKALKQGLKKVKEGQSLQTTQELAFPDQQHYWFEFFMQPVLDHNDQQEGIVIFAEDITERKIAEANFKQLEINFKSIFKQVAAGVMLYDLNFRIIYANQQFYDIIGYSPEEYSKLDTFDITHPDDVETSMSYANRLINGELENYSIEKRYIDKNGKVVWVYLTATIVRSVRGYPKHIISLVQDISKRKKVEEELLFKNNELDTFVYRASHDLKGPVASLKGLYSIVQVEFGQDAKAMEYFDHYNNNVNRLHTVIQNLLDLTKIKDAETKLKRINVYNMVQDLLASLENIPENQEITFKIDIDKDLVFLTDEGLLHTTMQNLIENAIKYRNPEVSPYVIIEASLQARVLKFVVTDNGIGIDPEAQKKVFHMFYRATDKASGSGLGLYLVKNAVDKLKGSIEMQSVLEEGTTFSVYIPDLQPE